MSKASACKPRSKAQAEPTSLTLAGLNDWRSAQTEHHRQRARVLVAYAAAFESEAKTATSAEQRTYLNKKGKAFRRDADRRHLKIAQLRDMPRSS